MTISHHLNNDNSRPPQFVYYGDKLPMTSENVLYLSNHQCTGMCWSRSRFVVVTDPFLTQWTGW